MWVFNAGSCMGYWQILFFHWMLMDEGGTLKDGGIFRGILRPGLFYLSVLSSGKLKGRVNWRCHWFLDVCLGLIEHRVRRPYQRGTMNLRALVSESSSWGPPSDGAWCPYKYHHVGRGQDCQRMAHLHQHDLTTLLDSYPCQVYLQLKPVGQNRIADKNGIQGMVRWLGWLT